MTAVHATEVGDTGARVVFLHGLMGQGKNFTSIAKALLPDARSLLVDLPSHGRSEWLDHVDYLEYADLVADRIRAWGEPVHLVGHSMGGKVAMVLAQRHPDLIERLVIVDITPGHSEGASEFDHLLGSLDRLDLASLTRRADADAGLKDAIPSDTVRGFLLQNLRSVPPSEGGGFAWQPNLKMLLSSLDVIGGFPDLDTTFDHPVLWIAGETSEYIDDEDHPAMRRLFPHTRFVTIKGAGHWVHSEQPTAFVSALKVFLQLESHESRSA